MPEGVGRGHALAKAAQLFGDGQDRIHHATGCHDFGDVRGLRIRRGTRTTLAAGSKQGEGEQQGEATMSMHRQIGGRENRRPASHRATPAVPG